jgi:hypothetical protein
MNYVFAGLTQQQSLLAVLSVRQACLMADVDQTDPNTLRTFFDGTKQAGFLADACNNTYN